MSNLSAEDENVRLAMCLLTLWESTRSAEWWFWLRKSLLLPFTQEQVTPGARCSSSTLQEGLISKMEKDTIELLPYGYMVSTWT